ncbi:hypothetical protein L6452_00980 [Arctium lappa]|uniref:Uncharacterized protein n=1 Tax=Arctium lappa TaxID=4217 RepID=A0ACB9FFV1_ARCLA|nr:hypothetical protein L6452_00980 [Arctium lappa]
MVVQCDNEGRADATAVKHCERTTNGAACFLAITLPHHLTLDPTHLHIIQTPCQNHIPNRSLHSSTIHHQENYSIPLQQPSCF